jgi:hypothetical protein
MKKERMLAGEGHEAADLLCSPNAHEREIQRWGIVGSEEIMLAEGGATWQRQ